MPEKNFVKTRLTCRHNTEYPIYCVRSELPVPDPLRCLPSSGDTSGAGSGSGAVCPCFSSLAPGELEARVRAVAPPWGQWIKRGHVVVEL